MVSIPQWCDCCTLRLTFENDDYLSFNPTMVRLLLRERRTVVWAKLRFNPTMVRLLLLNTTRIIDETGRFNPTMVRLLQFQSQMQICERRKFQSHNGAIAAPRKCPCQVLLQQVSIPQWCDCCYDPIRTATIHCEFQSHNGAIAAKAKFWVLGAE